MTGSAERAQQDGLKVSDQEIGSLRNRIFMVDSHYDPELLTDTDNDEEAFDTLMDYCNACDAVNRKTVLQDTGDVYPVHVVFFCMLVIYLKIVPFMPKLRVSALPTLDMPMFCHLH